MTTATLPDIEKLAEQVASRLLAPRSNQDRPLHLVGQPTTGKSTLLRLLKDRLTEAGQRVILIAPAAHEWDSGLSVVAQLAAALGALGEEGMRSAVLDPARAWDDKLGVIRDKAQKLQDILLLVDEIGPSALGSPPNDSPFGRCAEDAWQLLEQGIPWRRVLVPGKLANPYDGDSQQLQAASHGKAFLEDSSQWNGLGEVAVDLAKRARTDLKAYSPLELRLLVGIGYLTDVDRAIALTGEPRRKLSSSLADVTLHREELAGLRKVWGRLALVRVPFDNGLLDRLGAGDLGPEASHLLNGCLLFKTGEGLVLHETLRRDAIHSKEGRWIDESDARRTHEILAEYHTTRFQSFAAASSPQPQRAVMEQGEAFHHAQAAGDVSRAQSLQLGFVEELDALGRTLSKRWQRYGDAAEVFRLVLRLVPDHAYAHHYFAYNLDIQGVLPEEVESHYRRAVELDPSNTWWHGRLVNFYITRGRIRDARAQYSAALDQLLPIEDEIDPWLYQQFHRWIARLLLHRARLDFAREVLDAIPRRTRKDIPWVPELFRRLIALEEVEKHGAVFPAHLEPDQWWKGPHLFRRSEGRRGELEGWCAGRVADVDREGQSVRLWVGMPPDKEHDEPRYGWLEMQFAEFDRWTEHESAAQVEPDRFVEMAWFRNAEQQERKAIRVHEVAPPEELPKIFPPPDRYLRSRRQA
jgi:hypothetical protein